MNAREIFERQLKAESGCEGVQYTADGTRFSTRRFRYSGVSGDYVVVLAMNIGGGDESGRFQSQPMIDR